MVDSHILLLIFPGQGAINPALEFAKHLIRIGVKVTIVTTVFAHRRITAPIPEALTIVAFSDGYDEGFKLGDHDAQHFASELRSHGSRAIAELITASINEEGQGHPITHLVYTMGQTWAAEVARGLHIPSTPLWIQPATVFHIYYYYFNGYGDMIRKHTTTDPSCPIEIPGLPLLLTSRDLPSLLVPSNSNSYSFALPAFKEQLEYLLDTETNPPKVLVNTFDAIEPVALRAIEKINLIPIGPLVPPPSLDRKDYAEWLNSKPESSVVYVSFGSFVVLSKQQMEEIARGLLESRLPFMWVIRETEEIGDKLEELEQGGIVVPWCSQVDVLSHPSLGCFVTHYGWNSSLESLVSGVPMVGFPQFTDQTTNAKLIEDVWKTGVRVTPNEEGIVKGDEIKRCIEMVMGGEEFTRNAKKWKALASKAVKEGGSLDMNLKAFLDEL